MAGYVLFIDDKRNPTDYMFESHSMLNGEREYPIVVMRTSESAIEYVKVNGLPVHFCFDHDLGESSFDNEITVKIFVNWLFYEYKPDIIPSYSVHSDNPNAKPWIDSMFNSYARVLFNK